MRCEQNVELLPETAEIAELTPGVCPVDWAVRCVETAYENKCGKSVMCRDGLNQVRLILRDIVSGRGQSDDLELLKELCQVIQNAGGCALAEKAAGNVLYSLEHYAEEWDQHCRRKRCGQLVCKAYYSVYCVPEQCQGCGKCMEVCPVGAIAGGEGLICVVDSQACIRCGKCFEVCERAARGKYGAMKPRMPEVPVPVGSFATTVTRRRRRPSGD